MERVGVPTFKELICKIQIPTFFRIVSSSYAELTLCTIHSVCLPSPENNTEFEHG
ncbi:hypothetical protein LEP1GSC013_3390 [Leptospira interrogans serovar Valbuzzi str. Duyster]|nr:hypothetical protein LEP1GSC013_3390 [Leptospira interrogans serovar Valbuzzi str. Duyster]ENO72054.1 hypothetical protein LEP1GSC012_2456 [Leptospira interrogans serovar Valbuzzi str. Valbuzzi]